MIPGVFSSTAKDAVLGWPAPGCGKCWNLAGGPSRLLGVAVRPLGYGYVRVPPDLPDEDVRCLELGVRALADVYGLRLVGIYSEFQPGYYGVFAELITELRRSGARHVVVPSLDHLSRNPYLQALLVMRLAREADAQLWMVEPAGAQRPHG